MTPTMWLLEMTLRGNVKRVENVFEMSTLSVRFCWTNKEINLQIHFLSDSGFCKCVQNYNHLWFSKDDCENSLWNDGSLKELRVRCVRPHGTWLTYGRVKEASLDSNSFHGCNGVMKNRAKCLCENFFLQIFDRQEFSSIWFDKIGHTKNSSLT